MFTVLITLFKVLYASLMVPLMLLIFPTPNDHGFINSNFLQGSTPNHHGSTNIVQGYVYIDVHGSMNIV